MLGNGTAMIRPIIIRNVINIFLIFFTSAIYNFSILKPECPGCDRAFRIVINPDFQSG